MTEASEHGDLELVAHQDQVRAQCPCGWQGPWRTVSPAAVMDYHNHRDGTDPVRVPWQTASSAQPLPKSERREEANGR